MNRRTWPNILTALASYSLVTFVALSLVAARASSGRPGLPREFSAEAFPFRLGFPSWGFLLTALAALSFLVGLVPLLVFRGRVPWPLVAGAGAGLFWLALGFAGPPYSLGLTAPAGLAIVSVFLSVLVSAASLGRSFLQQDREGG